MRNKIFFNEKTTPKIENSRDENSKNIFSRLILAKESKSGHRIWIRTFLLGQFLSTIFSKKRKKKRIENFLKLKNIFSS